MSGVIKGASGRQYELWEMGENMGLYERVKRLEEKLREIEERLSKTKEKQDETK
jgi:hypothetical protein